ncbi:hypothetical protein [Rhodovulum sulfidophilum]|uniref:hypothetical protein n=1 Tax=Rhodovulum sulfidophilum TaxID=35806 RepID=UPI001913206D|nr:hypothetical protein [Rhodovulum sulfidophilum]
MSAVPTHLRLVEPSAPLAAEPPVAETPVAETIAAETLAEIASGRFGAGIAGPRETIEQAFLAMGSGLMAGARLLSDISGAHRDMALEFEGEAFLSGVAQIGLLRDEVGRVLAGIASGDAEIARLDETTRQVRVPLEQMEASIRLLGLVAVNARIVAAGIGSDQNDLNAFTSEMAGIAAEALGTVRSIAEVHDRVCHGVAETRRSQAAFSRDHWRIMTEIRDRLDADLQSLEAQRAQAAEHAGKSAALAAGIGAEVGTAVAAVQAGDMTRQRLEHVEAILARLGAAVERDGAPRLGRGRGGSAPRSGLRSDVDMVDNRAGEGGDQRHVDLFAGGRNHGHVGSFGQHRHDLVHLDGQIEGLEVGIVFHVDHVDRARKLVVGGADLLLEEIGQFDLVHVDLDVHAGLAELTDQLRGDGGLEILVKRLPVGRGLRVLEIGQRGFDIDRLDHRNVVGQRGGSDRRAKQRGQKRSADHLFLRSFGRTGAGLGRPCPLRKERPVTLRVPARGQSGREMVGFPLIGALMPRLTGQAGRTVPECHLNAIGLSRLWPRLCGNGPAGAFRCWFARLLALAASDIP